MYKKPVSIGLNSFSLIGLKGQHGRRIDRDNVQPAPTTSLKFNVYKNEAKLIEICRTCSEFYF